MPADPVGGLLVSRRGPLGPRHRTLCEETVPGDADGQQDGVRAKGGCKLCPPPPHLGASASVSPKAHFVPTARGRRSLSLAEYTSTDSRIQQPELNPAQGSRGE